LADKINLNNLVKLYNLAKTLSKTAQELEEHARCMLTDYG
jgi:hypothetical protein